MEFINGLVAIAIIGYLAYRIYQTYINKKGD